MAENTKHVSYADAGVDTAEGARAVDAIKAAVATTNRPEVIGGLGGFGSCFSAAALKDMEDPILVSGTDGVGTKLAIAQLLDRHETVGEDLVAMCGLRCHRQAARRARGQDRGRHRRGLPQVRLRARGRRDGRAPRRHGRR